MDGLATGATPALDTIAVRAGVAADINGLVSRDAKVGVRYVRDVHDVGHGFLTVPVPWRADGEEVAQALHRFGYEVRALDLVVTDGYELCLELELRLPRAVREDCVDCRGETTIVENRLDDRGLQQQIQITRFVCRDRACGRTWTRQADGG